MCIRMLYRYATNNSSAYERLSGSQFRKTYDACKASCSASKGSLRKQAREGIEAIKQKRRINSNIEASRYRYTLQFGSLGDIVK